MANVFTLEAVFAKKGDSLILHYGPWEKPKRILIDGGPRGVYGSFLKPRLQQIREDFEIDDEDPLRFEMVMVSHIDDDHINGILSLLRDNEKAKDRNRMVPYRVGTLWHNSFDDILGNAGKEIVSRLGAAAAAASGDALPPGLPKMTRESQAVVASTGQGRDLRRLARKLKVPVNKPFEGLVMSPAKKAITLGHGLSFTVLGPDKTRVVEFQKRWDKDLKKILKKKSARAASFSDKSPFNLASICVLARMKKRTMLLTGDARGDFVIEGLERAKLLKKSKPLHLDILKVPHHGSDNNVELSFFERVTADHYVISGDGEHGNPEPATLSMIADARNGDAYTIHFTFTEDAHLKEKDAKRKRALKKVQAWIRDEKPDGCAIAFREKADDNYSLMVDLLDPLYEEE